MERGGASVSSFSTLDFGEATRAGGSPELPEFLSSLAGPIHSIPNEDPELFDSEPILQHKPEVETRTRTEEAAEAEAEAEAEMEADTEAEAEAEAEAEREEAFGEVEGLPRV